MTDVFTPSKRSQIMAAIKGKDTQPEKAIRSLIHRMGYRFRLHRRDLPGNPDIVLPSHKKVIFVHGCFWHGHSACKRSALPRTNKSFWKNKIEGNRKRDASAKKRLNKLGWKSLTIWQCQISRSFPRVSRRILDFLNA
jgi:DNA mismatch endonuclease (patch repair protein)